MAQTAYHMEALRKARVLERKAEAMRNLQEQLGQTKENTGATVTQPTQLKYSETGHYAQNREFSKYPPQQTNRRKFVRRQKEDIIRKPTPELSYYKTGPMRDQLQYDHSRDGPIVDRTKYALKREFNFLGNSLSMLKKDIVPEHKPIPMCRRY